MTLLDRHLRFLDALRQAGLPVSLSEGLDAVAALSVVGWSSRQVVHDTYATTLVKRASYRATFDELFELYFPRRVGSAGSAGSAVDADDTTASDNPERAAGEAPDPLAAFSEQLAAALASADAEALRDLAAEAMARFGAMPGRGPGLSSWSSYTALRRVDPQQLTSRLVAALMGQGWTEEEATRTAGRRTREFAGLVEADARRRIAEEKSPEHMARVAVRPTLEALDFLSMRRDDLDALRREVYPLARRLASRLAREQHARRRGPLDMRRTVRASIGSGGVPVVTHHKPKRPHRTELVVLCDVSGSVAGFASFTLLLVSALREVFTKVRAFTFVDQIVEVTDTLRPGGDLAEQMTQLIERSAFAARLGRTNYGNALRGFREEYADALTPRSSLLILGDARSNYADPQLDALRDLAGRARHAWWLNPEVRGQWDTGDSEASRYAEVVPMVECRNLTQLSEFVHDIV